MPSYNKVVVLLIVLIRRSQKLYCCTEVDRWPAVTRYTPCYEARLDRYALRRSFVALERHGLALFRGEGGKNNHNRI